MPHSVKVDYLPQIEPGWALKDEVDQNIDLVIIDQHA